MENLFIHHLVDHLPWTFAGPLRKRFPAPTGYYYLVSQQPLIILIPEDFFDEISRWLPFFNALKQRRVYFLGRVRSGIEYDPAAYKQLISTVLKEHSQSYPEHRFVFLANNDAQTQIFNELNLESVFVNHNCLIDDTLFQVNPETPKKFDAIYNGVSAPYKRFELASQINSLAIITYLQFQHLSYFKTIKEVLNKAKWLNFPTNNVNVECFKTIPHQKISSYLNQSRVGLCLSHVEGAMLASIEYLLAGLPVVSTPSYGGRDVFFDDSYTLIVEDNAKAVSEGVAIMAAKKLDPLMIRQATLNKIAEHRERFVKLVESITIKEGLEADAKKVYAMNFPKHIYKLRPLHKILNYI
ncbi:MAG: glycosyltransferase [Methylococcaceae bacterium]|jgi:glycosyltransferase involved in cell wall biosynthesis